ncbi:MAG: ATP-binding protein [Hyphomicrobiales bacterium]
MQAILDGGKSLGGALYSEAGTARRTKRAQARAVASISAADRVALREGERQARRQRLEEARAAAYLPKNGEHGADALRTYRALKVEPHRATSEVLAGAYPFLAESGLGSQGVLIGQDAWSGAGFVYDPWVLYRLGILTNPNCLLAGVVGRGKSTLAKSLATRSIAFGRKCYVPGDPKGEWTAVSRSVGGQAIELGGGTQARLNPLDAGARPQYLTGLDGAREPVTDVAWGELVLQRRRDLLRSLTEAALGRPIAPVESTALYAALDESVRANSVPVLPHVVSSMFDPPGDVIGSNRAQLLDDGREVAHAVNRLVGGDLGGLFDGPSTVRFDADLPMVSLDLSRIAGSDAKIGMVMACASSWMEAALQDPSGGQRWVIYDEAWRVLKQPALLARMQSQWKLSRALGIANLMVIHRLSDLDAVGERDSAARNLALGLLADCSTKIIYAQESGEDAKTGAALGLSSTETLQLSSLARGEGLWRIGERSFVVRHVCTPGELILFDTNQRMETA